MATAKKKPAPRRKAKGGKKPAGKSGFWQRVKKWSIRIIAGFFILSIVSTLLFRFIPIPLTPLMLYRSTGQLLSGEDVVMKKDWVPMSEISRNLQLAVICSEDQHFAEHAGFDWKAIDKAMSENEKRVKRGKPIRGASTISQQCAKNVFLVPNRTWIRKALEVYFTVLIEVCWSKERILEVYLNVIEMGDGIYGAEAAAQAYFQKSAARLNREQSARIAAILPNPRKFSASRPSPYIRKRTHWILAQMRAYGSLDLDADTGKK